MREYGEKVGEQGVECKFCPLFAAGATIAAQPSLPAQQNLGRTEAREGALDEVDPHKSREKKPPLADKENKRHAHKDHRSRQNPDKLIAIHCIAPFVLIYEHTRI
jgi:hypothetical protein